uniref:Uncharacterized protein n=1 Tax=Arundo donax TaxID=35708 RepID=A0A0A9CJR8_ARUDO
MAPQVEQDAGRLPAVGAGGARATGYGLNVEDIGRHHGEAQRRQQGCAGCQRTAEDRPWPRR